MVIKLQNIKYVTDLPTYVWIQGSSRNYFKTMWFEILKRKKKIYFSFETKERFQMNVAKILCVWIVKEKRKKVICGWCCFF